MKISQPAFGLNKTTCLLGVLVVAALPWLNVDVRVQGLTDGSVLVWHEQLI